MQECFSKQNTYYDIDCRIKHKDGHWVWVNDKGQVVKWGDGGKPLWMRGTHTDITERKSLEIALYKARQRFETIVQNIPGATYRCLCDDEWTMKFISQNIELMTGYPPSDFIDNRKRSYASIISPEDVQLVEEMVIKAVNKKVPYEIEYRIIDSDEVIHWVLEKGLGVYDEQGIIEFLDGTIIDITDRKHNELEVLRLSVTDGLTGLLNRRYFMSEYEKERKRAVRDKFPLSILMIDIDYFKQYNDTYGHLSGDDCLITVSIAIRESISRPGDCVARFGGEEFIILLANTKQEGAEVIAEEILKSIRNTKVEHKSSNVSPYISVSIGLASTVPSNDLIGDKLIQQADDALYLAKERGRNQIAFVK